MLNKIRIIKIHKIPKQIKDWVNWLNDKEVTKFSNQRYKFHTIQTQKKFIAKKINSKKNILFKICYKNFFIGILEISKINNLKNECELSYMIGNKSFWGKGYGTKAINLAINFSKKKLKVKKIIAGVEKKNISSKKILLKNNFKLISKKNNILFFENYL
jgi:[ribosomal protein S5]-alanine N-acetyltransferase